MIRDLEVQDTTSFEIIDMLINTWTLYEFTLRHIDITQKDPGTPAANLLEGLKEEDIRVARLISEVVYENLHLADFSRSISSRCSILNYVKNERNMTETQIREIMAAGNKHLKKTKDL